MSLLHRRASALLALIALGAFVTGAGLDAPGVAPAALLLVLAVFVQPGEERARALEPLWRAAAIVLAARATLRVIGGGTDPVLPMVDLLLLLLCAESLRVRDGSGDARHFALTFALLIAAAAYRPGPLFGLLYVAYVACAMVVLVLGHLARQARRRGVEPPPPRLAFLARIGALSSVVLLTSALVFTFFPRVSRGWAARPELVRAVVGFGNRVSLDEHGARIEPNPQIVMRVEFPDGPPSDVRSLHWRGRAYNDFDGWTWRRSPGRSRSLPERAEWHSPVLRQVIYGKSLTDTRVLFGLPPILEITAESAIRPMRVSHGDFIYDGDSEPVYRVASLASQPPLRMLRASAFAATDPRERLLAENLAGSSRRLPEEAISNLQLPVLSARTRALADSFRLAAPTLYEHVAAIERWLRTEFTYTLELPPTRREATLDHFLFERRAGHCEYFSTALAVLLRAGGVPARNVNGFLGGEWNEFGQFLTITQNHAHSWVEVYFPNVGWVTFDATPPAAAAAGAGRARGLNRVRLFVEGFEHRWSKWILDYDVGRQSAFLDRLRRPFGVDSAPAADNEEPGAGRSYVRPFLALAVLLLGALLAARRLRWRNTATSAATRLYLSLRRTYERAGLAAGEAHTPLAFATAVRAMPGGADACRAVELYLRLRFSPQPTPNPDQQELRARVRAAQRAMSGR